MSSVRLALPGPSRPVRVEPVHTPEPLREPTPAPEKTPEKPPVKEPTPA